MIRHRKVEIDPSDHLAVWRAKYAEEHDGKPVRDTVPEGYDQKRNDAFNDHDIFCTIVKAFIRDQQFDINAIIHNYWRLAFRKPFPKEGGSLSQLCTMIRLRLLQKGFERNDIDEDPEKVIKVRFPNIIPHKFNAYQINSQQSEDCMSEKKKKDDSSDKDEKRKRNYTKDDEESGENSNNKGKKEKKEKFPDPDDMDEDELREYIKENEISYDDDLGFDDKAEYKDASKKELRKALAKFFEKKSKSKGGKAKKPRSDDKAGQCRVLCAELLMKQKYTDKKISEMVEEEVGIPYSVKRVARIRDGINEGKRERLGIPTPKPPLKEIGGEGKKSND